jgi:hypothetical protein
VQNKSIKSLTLLERRHPDGKIARAISVTLAIGNDERPSEACRQDDGVPKAH